MLREIPLSGIRVGLSCCRPDSGFRAKRRYSHRRGGGGGRPVPEPQGVPREVRVVPKPFPDGFQEDKLRDGGQNIGLPVDMLVDTVARMQDLAMLREENRVLRTPATSQVIQAPRRAALTTTKVPRFDGTTSWEQYHQVFEAIVRSNGWDNDTAALQLFSHLEGDALNVAHLVPLARRLSRSGLVDALTAHYGSPGRLADYRRQFERTTRTVGEDPAMFATALETLAVNAFGDMGQTARLRLIRDRFIAGHCDLRRHLDSVSPETPIRDVVDRCRVWESHAHPVRVSRRRIRYIRHMQSATQTICMKVHNCIIMIVLMGILANYIHI